MADELQDLPDEYKQRMETFRTAAKDLVKGDRDTVEGAVNQLMQLLKNSDFNSDVYLNSLHVPENAGEYEDDLRDMLMRIPDGWGRWISCGKGWYELLVDTHLAIKELLPNYAIHQVKEKYGTLRYYWDSGEDIYSVINPSPKYPGREAPDELKDKYHEEFEKWSDRREAWYETEEGKKISEELRVRSKKVDEIVDAAELKSASICEKCGSSEAHLTERGGWLSTNCIKCAKERNSTLVPQHLYLKENSYQPHTTDKDAERTIKLIKESDPKEVTQVIELQLYGGKDYKNNTLQEASLEYLEAVCEYVKSRVSSLAIEWRIKPQSTIQIFNITDETKKLLSATLAKYGLEDIELERKKRQAEAEARWAKQKEKDNV